MSRASACAGESAALGDIDYRPQGMTVEQLREGLRELVEELQSDKCLRERRERFVRARGPKERRSSLWTHFREASAMQNATV
jgi:hypothetical protein